ncbi:hypothetical protein BC826DRAFT_1174287 [Russula brevipes]|nr:hypothetical protein BC826DRAFT_1174287 [Russula brevipes]
MSLPFLFFIGGGDGVLTRGERMNLDRQPTWHWHSTTYTCNYPLDGANNLQVLMQYEIVPPNESRDLFGTTKYIPSGMFTKCINGPMSGNALMSCNTEGLGASVIIIEEMNRRHNHGSIRIRCNDGPIGHTLH